MKHHWKLILPFAAMAALCAVTPAAHADLLGYWPFEDSDGTVVTDFSGNDNHGEASDTFAFTDDGFQGRAGDFGDFANNAFVAIPSAADGAFDSIVESQSATVSFWMSRGDAPAQSQWTFIFDGGSDSSDPITGRQFASHAPWGDGNVYFDTGGCCGGSQRISTALPSEAITPGPGNWVHMAYVRDGETTTVYVNGGDLLVHSSGVGAITSPIAPIIQATIGANAAGGGSQNGLIDEFAIWDEALPLGRIIALSAGGSPLPPMGLPGDFNGDEIVTIDDFNIMAMNFGQRFSFEEALSKGDYNGDLRVNLKDFLAFRQAWNAPAGAAVPEPSSIVLIGWTACGLFGLRRRRR